jgi:hypothetical protein
MTWGISMRITLVAIAIFIGFLLLSLTAGAQAQNAEPTPCKITNDYLDISPDVRWKGECKDGFASGEGIATWYRDGIEYFSQFYNPDIGIIRSQGATTVVRETIDKSVTLSLARCYPNGGGWVKVRADDQIAVSDSSVVYYISSKVPLFVKANCPHYFREDIEMGMEIHVEGFNSGVCCGEDERDRAVIYSWSGSPRKTYQYNNFSLQQLLSQAQDRRWRGDAVRIFAQQQAQLRAQQEAAEIEKNRVAQAKMAIRAPFISENKPDTWASDAEVTANPFLYKGKVVGIRSRFTRMVSETDAIFTFNNVIQITGVPSTRFRGSEDVVLAVKILGTKDTLPYGEYIGAYVCTQGCSEFFD